MVWIKYIWYCYQVKSGEEVDMVAQKHLNHTLWDLDCNDKGYPLLPPCQVRNGLQFMKKLIWSFITAYSLICTRLCLRLALWLSAVETDQRTHGQFHWCLLSACSHDAQYHGEGCATGGSQWHEERTNCGIIGTLEEASARQQPIQI